MSSYSETTASTGPSPAGIAGAIAFVVVASALVLLSVGIIQQPGWVWALRIATVLGGAGLAIGLIVREKIREGKGLPLDRDTGPFDLWTIAHFMLGVILGAWGVPGPLVVVITIAWEIFEATVPGFGDGEVLSNRAVDVGVALVGWLIIAGIVALGTSTPLPLLIPSSHSLVRDAWLRLF